MFLWLLKFFIGQNLEKSSELLDLRFAVLARDRISSSIFVDGVYEREAIENIKAVLQYFSIHSQDRIMVDVGAHIGNHSRQLFHLFGGVEAFEPNPDIFELLVFNLKPFPSIRAHNYGLGEVSRSAILHLDRENTGSSSVVREVSRRSKSEERGLVKIQLKTLDELKFSKEIGLIKIDTEGMELSVLKGARKSIENAQPIVAFEQLAGRPLGPRDQTPVVDFLLELGYSFIYEKPLAIGWQRILHRFRQITRAASGLPRVIDLVLWDSVPLGRFSLVIAVHNSVIAAQISESSKSTGT